MPLPPRQFRENPFKEVFDFQRHRPKLVLGAWILAGILTILIANSTWYSVPADSEAVVLRLGHISESAVQPGLHFKLPLGIDVALVVPVKRQLKLEFGNPNPLRDATNPYQYGDDDAEKVKNIVTGDLNAAHVEWVVTYHIGNLQNYLFHTRGPEETLRDAAEAAMREVVGDRTVDEVLTIGRLEVEVEALKRLSALATLYELGLMVDQVQLVGVNPPPPVRQSFDDVNQAQQEREQKINVARAAYSASIPQAKGEALKLISEAEGNALKRTNEAAGDAGRFQAVFTEYVKSPEITRQRLYLETMTKIIPLMGRKVILDDSARNVLPFLPLNDALVPPPAAPATSRPTTTPPSRK